MSQIDMKSTENTDRSDLVVDGRTARRNRNKSAVLDALIALADEGETEPAIEVVADRAGVSYRSVYRYFEDRTDLLLSAIGRVIGDNGEIFVIEDLGNGPLEVRISRLVEMRIAAYRKLASLTRMAVQRRAHEPAVGENYDRVRSWLRTQIEAQFEPELSGFGEADREIVVAAIDVVFQFEALDFLVHHEGFDDAALARLLTRHIRVHLDAVSA